MKTKPAVFYKKKWEQNSIECSRSYAARRIWAARILAEDPDHKPEWYTRHSGLHQVIETRTDMFYYVRNDPQPDQEQQKQYAYTVNIMQTVEEYATLEVYAESEEDAREKAQAMLDECEYDVEWEGGQVDRDAHITTVEPAHAIKI